MSRAKGRSSSSSLLCWPISGEGMVELKKFKANELKIVKEVNESNICTKITENPRRRHSGHCRFDPYSAAGTPLLVYP